MNEYSAVDADEDLSLDPEVAQEVIRIPAQEEEVEQAMASTLSLKQLRQAKLLPCLA